MKRISLQIVINGVRSKVDGSLGLSLSTPELSTEEKVEVMKLQGQVLQAVFIPTDEPSVPEYKIERDIDSKTPSQRLRACLFVLHQQSGDKREFEEFYREHMNKLIEFVKGKLE